MNFAVDIHDNATSSPSAAAMEIRVMVVDDHTSMRRSLVELLDGTSGFRVVGEAADGLEAIAAAKRCRPDVVLMDISMPGMSGTTATRRILAEMPHIKIVALSMHDSEQMRREMRDAGTQAYLTKSADASEVCATIQRVAREG